MKSKQYEIYVVLDVIYVQYSNCVVSFRGNTESRKSTSSTLYVDFQLEFSTTHSDSKAILGTA